MQKTVIINRAVPGSGKTTITNCIVNELRDSNISVSIHSTDEYFMVGNRYMFDIAKLGQYHDKNLEEFEKSIQNGIDVVICDNTNLMPWQTEPYTVLARKYNYQILFITLDPRELEKHIESQKITPQKPDAHGVEEDILIRMINEYNTYNDLLNKNTLIDKTKHIRYKWHNGLKKKIPIGMAKYFDSDHIIRILPDKYKDIQNKIGSIVKDLINQDLDIIKTKETELYNAIMYEDIESIANILKHNIDLIECIDTLNCLEYALFKGDYRIIEEFYNYFDTDIKQYIKENWSNTIHLASYLNYIDGMKTILQNGIDINKQDKDGNTSLHIAVSKDNIEMIELLLGYSIDVCIGNNNNDLPLYLTIKHKNTNIISKLIDFYQQNGLLADDIITKYCKKIIEIKDIKLLDFVISQLGLDINHNLYVGIFKDIFMQDLIDFDRHILLLFLDKGFNINNNHSKNKTFFQYARENQDNYQWLLNYIQKKSNNNYYSLPKILSNFSVDKPIKYTVHSWDFGEVKKEYGSFDKYMSKIKEQFEEIKAELKKLSPILYKKIHTFLLETNPSKDYSWCSKADINIGWSNLKGLKNIVIVVKMPLILN